MNRLSTRSAITNRVESTDCFRRAIAILVRVSGVMLLLVSVANAAEPVSFNRDIRPILSENCFACHGPDAKTREADLRLDQRDGEMGAVGESMAFVPGHPEKSSAIERVTSTDDDLRMPPPASEKKLTAEQIELLRRWIAEGADYELHWAFVPVKWPALPQVKNTQWPRNAIDHFVLRRLESKGIEPSPEADRYTLVRRVYLDLLGLPPTIDQVTAFVEDGNPDAYQRMLDRVLASPRFGERWGRFWLDQARYADSHGYTNDNERIMWPFRDWVINAFNRDLPFDQFTTEQLAGDLLKDPSLDQLVATGFHRNTLINSEGGTKADQFRDEQVKDRVDTTGGVWLGLTVGCAKCHTHKYDPISQTEYYQLYSFFNSTADSNSISPTIKAPTSQQADELAALDNRIAELKRRLDGDGGRNERQVAWEQELLKQAAAAADDSPSQDDMWTVLSLDAKSSIGAEFDKLEDQSVVARGANEAADEYKATALSPLTTIRSVRLEALKHESLPSGGPGRAGNGNFVLSEFWFRTGDGRELRFAKAAADHSQPDYPVAASIDGKTNTGWAINGSPEGGANHNRVAWFVLPSPLEVEKEHALTFTMQFNNGNAAYNLGRFRISVSDQQWVDMPSATDLARLVNIPGDQRSKEQKQRLEDAFLQADAELGPVYAEWKDITKQREQLSGQVPSLMVMRELDSPRQAHVQIRGEFLRTSDPVKSDVPAILPPMPDGDEPRTRLDLSHWLVRADNPLTPRVRINRIWMRLFGNGLVETENDFGIQGTLPTHPELLDWLASEFIRRDWSTKAMLRLIASSATYRQSSNTRPDLAKVDPRNLLLARQSRLRVEGEIVRDIGLSVSGLLSDKIGGPSVYPPQPDGVYAFTQRAKNWRTSDGEDRYRRGMYTFFYRSAPYPMLTTFDAPKFNTTCTRRDRSNTPLQSLTVANNEAIFEMTQQLARRVLVEVEGSDQQRIAWLFQLCFARPPQPAEADFLLHYLENQRQHFKSHMDDAQAVAAAKLDDEKIAVSDAAAWTATARVLLNLDEFITRE